MVKYIFVVCVVLMSFITFSSPAKAQSPCGDLSRDDCEILQTAQLATSNLDAAGFEMTMDMSFGIQFLPNLISARVVANGVYSRVPVTRDDLEAPYNELFGLNADMSVLVDAEVSEFVSPQNNTLTTALDLRYVDGVGYADLSKVLPLISPYAEIGSWYSADAVDYLSRLMRDAIIPPDFLEVLATSFGIDYWSGFATNGIATRTDNIQQGDQTFAVFEVALLVSDYFDENVVAKEVIITAFEDFLQAQYGGIYSDKALRDSAVYYADLFKYTEINLMQMVGLADGYVHHTHFDILFAPDASTIAPLESDPLGLAMLGTVELRFSLDFRYTQFENIPLVSAPEDASPVRYEDIFGYGDSFPF